MPNFVSLAMVKAASVGGDSPSQLKDKKSKIRLYLISILVFFLVELTHIILLKNYSALTNAGFVFGLLCNNLLSIIISILLLVLIYWYIEEKDYFWAPASLIGAGSMANIVDRVTYGGSQDYIDFWLIPTFNIPDILIVLGGCWFFVNLSLNKEARND